MPEDIVQRKGLRVLLMLACIVLLIAALREAANLMRPFLVAVFLAVLSTPPMRKLQRLGLPTGLAIAIVVAMAIGVLTLVAAVLGQSLRQFEDALPDYQRRLDALLTQGILWLQAQGLEVEQRALSDMVDADFLLEFVPETISALFSAVANVLLVTIMLLFMLFEANRLPDKLRRGFFRDPQADLSEFQAAAERVQKYLSLKSLTSLATGALVTALTALVGLDFPLFWGLVAFLFNFVPNIGSIIAAVPAVLVALVQFDIGYAFIVALGYLAINVTIGNLIEPRLMGRRLGLSTLVVFLSMVFWGWVWGPVGMLLSVPLTVMLKIALEHSDDFYWLAVLLGPGKEDLPDPSPAAAGSEDARR